MKTGFQTMTTQTLDQKTIALLVSTGGLREVRAVREGPAWALQCRIGQDWLAVRSARQELRLWSSLDTLERFCVAAGVRQLTIEL